jgi:hypothetical protein
LGFLVPLLGAEAAAASVLTFLASAIVSAYAADWCGLRIVPAAILIVSLLAAGAVFWRAAGIGVWRAAGTSSWSASLSGEPHARDDDARQTILVFAAIVAATFAWLLWLARPEFLPTGSGPDLVHHLALIEYIQQHWTLVHDVRLSEYLGEMVDYTPGFHLLVALAGAWLPGIDALHAAYPVVALTVAIKAGVVFLIARRLVAADVPRDPFALAAVLVLLAPRVYSTGSFTEQSYLAQVVSELFALAAWWMLIVWDQRPSPAAMWLFALFVVAGFLVWPVWSGPLLLVLVAIALSHTEISFATRARQIAPPVIAVAAIAAVHGARHVGGFRIAGTGGFAIAPTTAVIAWPFVAASAVAVVASAFHRRTRIVALLVAAIALQAAGLLGAARASGAAAPYLAIKMFYLAIYPMAIAIAVLMAEAWRAIAARAPRLRTPAVAWSAAAIVGILCAAPAIAAPRPRPVVTEPVLQAAIWAGRHAPRDCIDYLTRDGYTAYWLHLAVFGNARASGRATDDDTFEPKKALVRWILPGGLPYAITDDFAALPRDIRENVDVVARFGDAAVVKRRHAAAACP